MPVTPRSDGFELTGAPTSATRIVGDVWRVRPLIAVLARKEFFVRYRRASFGVAWAVVLPLVQAAVMALVLSRFVRFATGGSYVVFVFSGLLGWTFFAAGLSAGAASIVEGQGLSTKIYFPRAVFPLVSVLSGGYGLVVGAVILLGLEVAVGGGVGLEVLWLAPALALTVTFTCLVAAVAAVANVYARDVRYAIQAALTPMLYLTPVLYPLDAVGRLSGAVRLNPLTGVVEMFRAATVGADRGWGVSVASTLVASLVLAAVAIALLQRVDRTSVDLL